VGWKIVRQVADCCEYDNEHKMQGIFEEISPANPEAPWSYWIGWLFH
jgi:hypothetical protein